MINHVHSPAWSKWHHLPQVELQQVIWFRKRKCHSSSPAWQICSKLFANLPLALRLAMGEKPPRPMHRRAKRSDCTVPATVDTFGFCIAPYKNNNWIEKKLLKLAKASKHLQTFAVLDMLWYMIHVRAIVLCVHSSAIEDMPWRDRWGQAIDSLQFSTHPAICRAQQTIPKSTRNTVDICRW